MDLSDTKLSVKKIIRACSYNYLQKRYLTNNYISGKINRKKVFQLCILINEAFPSSDIDKNLAMFPTPILGGGDYLL